MRFALWLLALFALAVAFTLAARLDPGYVIIVYPPWRLELSFMLALLLLVGISILAFLLIRLAGIALKISADVRVWREKRRNRKANQALLDALRAHFDGDLTKAEKLAAMAVGGTLAPDLVERLLRPKPVASPAVGEQTAQTPHAS